MRQNRIVKKSSRAWDFPSSGSPYSRCTSLSVTLMKSFRNKNNRFKAATKFWYRPRLSGLPVQLYRSLSGLQTPSSRGMKPFCSETNNHAIAPRAITLTPFSEQRSRSRTFHRGSQISLVRRGWRQATIPRATKTQTVFRRRRISHSSTSRKAFCQTPWLMPPLRPIPPMLTKST